MLFAVIGDTPGSAFLGCREACAQSLPWRPIEEHRPEDRRVCETWRWHGAGEPEGGDYPVGGRPDIVALASPRDAVAGGPGGLYALRRDGIVLIRPATADAAPWSVAGRGPAGARALAATSDHFFVLDEHGLILSCPQGQLAHGSWREIDHDSGLVALTGMSGRLYAVDGAGTVLTRSPAAGGTWRPVGDAGGCTVLACRAGILYGSSPGLPTRRVGP